MESKFYQQETVPVDMSNTANTFLDLKIRHRWNLKHELLPGQAEQLHTRKSTKEGEDHFENYSRYIPLPDVSENEVDLRKGKLMSRADRCSIGYVTFCTKKDMKDMLQNLPKLSHGFTVDRGLFPEGDKYEFNNFYKRSMIGKGSFGDVHLYVDTNRQKILVIKKIKKEQFHNSEVIVPLHLKHQNIVQVYGVRQRDDDIDGQPVIEIMLEYAGISLTQYLIRDMNFLTPRQIWNLTRQALAALSYLDSNAVIHLDIKPDNICVQMTLDNQLLLKLTDFGSACLQQEALKLNGMTPKYMAPELCKAVLNMHCAKILQWMPNAMTITCKVDSYACGLVIEFMYRRCHLLENVQMATNDQKSYVDNYAPESKNKMNIALIVLIATQPGLLESLRPKECDEDMHKLLTRLTEHDHRKRWSAAEALTYITDREQRIAKQFTESDTKKYPEKKGKQDLHFHPYNTGKVGKTHGSKGMKSVVDKTKCQDSLPNVLSPRDVMSPPDVMSPLDVMMKISDLPNMQPIQESSMRHDHLEFMLSERNNSMVSSEVVSVHLGKTMCRQLQNCQQILPQQQPNHRTIKKFPAQQQQPHTQCAANKYEAMQLQDASRNAMIGQAQDTGYSPNVNNNSNLIKKKQANQRSLNAVKEMVLLNMAKKHVTQAVMTKPSGPEKIMSQGSTGKMFTAHMPLYDGSSSHDMAMSPPCNALQMSLAMDMHSHVQWRGNELDLTQQKKQMGNMPKLDQLMDI